MVQGHADSGASVELTCEGRAVARYVWDPQLPTAVSPRPYLHPVTTLGGTTITGFMPDDHEHHLGRDQLLRRCDGLLGPAPVVGRHQLDTAAEHAARAVDPVDRELDCRARALARGGEGAGQRVGDADPDGVVAERGCGEQGRQHQCAAKVSEHRLHPWSVGCMAHGPPPRVG